MDTLTDLPMTVDAFQRVVKTLGDSTRLRLLALLERQELSVADVVKVLDLPQSTVSRHLAHLKDQGLLAERRDGAFCYSRFKPPGEGAWCSAWSLARESLRDDPQIAADAEALDALLRARTLGSREFFDSLGAEWDRLRKVFQDDLQRARAIGRLVPRGLKIADVGTGTGVLAMEMARLGMHIVAVDQSEAMLAAAEAKRTTLPDPGRVELRQGTATDLPLADGEVDAVLAHMVLHYVPSPRDAIRELARVVRPGGRVVLVDFTAPEDRPQPDREWLQKDLGVIWQGFATTRIREWLHEAGLCNVEVELHEAASEDRDLPTTFIASADRKAGTHT
ncbi:MAG: metalloregulator ArsR/SmtB family transcription factor [Planctomycetota bacterium]